MAKVLWFTGLSGSGKSTLCDALMREFNQKKISAKLLDGDELREKLHSKLSFRPEDIKKHAEQVTQLCLELSPSYEYLLVSVITPFESSRKYARSKIGRNYVEIFVNAGLLTAEQRDVKGLYKKAREGQISHFIGIDPRTPYEQPLHPDLTLDTNQPFEKSFSELLRYLDLKPTQNLDNKSPA